MIPSRFIPVDRIPRTQSGKLDRKALHDLDRTHVRDDRALAAPRTREEGELTQLFGELFELDDVGVHDSFFDLGGNSLLAIRLMTSIAASWKVDLPLRDLFEGPTPAELALTISILASREALDQLRQSRALDLHAEVVLDADIRPPEGTGSVTTPPREILLTGATGFLGGWLLHDLLRLTEATIHCLVRAPDAAIGEARLRKHLDTLGLPAPISHDRIRIVPGDLAQRDLGLGAATHGRLSATVDTIYHCGASTSFFLPYESLKAINVSGTHEIIRLACTTRTKTLHHVSTIGVFDTQDPPDAQVLDETADLDDFTDLLGGYARSKWVAEKLVQLAASRGLPVTIYRPGRIVSNSLDRDQNRDDFGGRLLAGCLELGSAPEIASEMDLTPVDFVSAALVRLSLDHAPEGRAWHLMNPEPATQRSLIDSLEKHGRTLRIVSPEEWQHILTTRVASNPTSPLYPLLPLLQGTESPTLSTPSIFCSLTQAALAGTGITCPPAATWLT